ncbi:hypothetical protein PENTCL1PPCAC_19857, partial [Pristionchus entomophagus]
SYRFHNVYKFDLITNELTRVFTNTRFAAATIGTDNDMRIRLAYNQQDDGTRTYFRVSSNANPENLTSSDDDWEEYFNVRDDDIPITTFLRFDKSNKNAYWIWGEDTDLGKNNRSFQKHLEEKDIVRENMFNSFSRNENSKRFQDRTLLTLSEYHHYINTVAFDKSVRKDVGYLKKLRPTGHLQILDKSRDMQTWLVTYQSAENTNDVSV